jgi:hypothetical protein
MEELARCSVCSRTPLVGEEVTVFAGERLVCDPCRAKPRVRAFGEPVRRERIRTAAGAANVKRIYPRPVDPRPATVPGAPARAV